MGKATSVIEINGASYDATTGNAIGSAKRLAPMAVIDGFVRKTSRPKAAKPVAKAKTRRNTSQVRSTRTAHVAAKTVHHRTEKSQTLVRSGLDRPALKIKSAVKSLAKPVNHKGTFEAIRTSRAAQITKHAAVSRFGSPRPRAHAQDAVEAKAVRVRPRAHVAATAAAPSITASHQTLERMLDEALANADAHKQLLQKQRYGKMPFKRVLLWPRWVQIVLALLLMIIVGLVVSWRYVPQVSVNLVARKAGINAAVPAYVPAGYRFTKAASLPAGVSIEYKASEGASSYAIEQTKSSADSASTVANTVAKGATVQTAQVNGNTVYIYGNESDAVWVNNGTEYTIKNSAGLSSEQLLHIVQGL